MPFIANGEICELLYYKNQRTLYDIDFATLGLAFPDHKNEPSIECNAIMDTLDVDSPSLSEERMKKLYMDVKLDLAEENGPSEIRGKMQKDPWYNALQIKYGYAITCHKAQGGQWPIVFVDRGFVTEESMDKEYWRWLYTAVTRASEKLYLINF
jgi:exodeoxyribonuclease-5